MKDVNIEGMELYRDRCEMLVTEITKYFETKVDTLDDNHDYVKYLSLIHISEPTRPY